MKKVFAIAVFLSVWFMASGFLLDQTWWQSFLYKPVAIGVAFMAGMSVGASMAILVLNVLDWVFNPDQEQAVANTTTYAR